MSKKYVTKVNLKTIVLSIGLIFGVSTTAFASGDHDHGKMDHSKMKHGARKMLNHKSKSEVIAMLEANEKLHHAFFTYSGKSVEAAASNMLSTMRKVSHAEISKLIKFSQTKVADIKAANDRDKNNNNYNALSQTLALVLKKYDLGKSYNTYYCPMVKKKWLQNSVKIKKTQNPYAENMPNCGEKKTNY